VSAALAIGAECIAVGTSGIELHALESAGARLAVATLEDPRVREHLLARC
jgi:beta-phosphoglucomutase-like phosphatase (HAD superfamily)